jgi:hypothetical protein
MDGTSRLGAAASNAGIVSAQSPALSFSLDTGGEQTQAAAVEAQTIVFGAHMSMKYLVSPDRSYIEGRVELDRTAW